MRQNLLLLLLQLVNHANGEVDLFRSDCGQCGNNAVCEDILVKTQRDIRQLDHPHVKEGTHILLVEVVSVRDVNCGYKANTSSHERH